jgi:hypothetical protein
VVRARQEDQTALSAKTGIKQPSPPNMLDTTRRQEYGSLKIKNLCCYFFINMK